MNLKFLLDVNASGAVSEWLRNRGYDIVEVGQTDCRMSDEKILDWALKEKRIVVTTDKDFEEMISLQARKHCGILRLENLPRSERLLLLADVLAQHAKDFEEGAIIIAKTTKYRIRRK